MPPDAWIPLEFPLLPQPDRITAANPAQPTNENRVFIANVLSPNLLSISVYEWGNLMCNRYREIGCEIDELTAT
jgi:hypothetical protein